MIYKFEWVENKSQDWKLATISGVDGSKHENVSINRANKKGEIFPNFDGITPGVEMEATFWTSSQGKNYLFAPDKITNSPKFVRKPAANIAAAMEKKAEYISNAQDNKENGIKVSSTMRMAVDLAIAQLSGSAVTPADLEQHITRWRAWLWNEWDADNSKFPPFN